MQIRCLTPSDAADYHKIRLEGLRAEPSVLTASHEEESVVPLSVIEQRLAPGSGRIYFGAFEGDVLIGIARLDRDGSPKQSHRAHIRGVYVSAAHRGKGAARKLMEYALAAAESLQGVTHVGLAVTAGNAPAQKLYESLGFKAWGYEPAALIVDGVVYDEIPMTKVLQPASSRSPGDGI